MSAPTAAWPVPSLTTSLRKAGWGELSGRSMQGVRSTLLALESLLPHGSGEGLATAAQIADSAGLTERWVRECLRLMEDNGLIRWVRGGVDHGRPVPSWFRIDKRALVGLIRRARTAIERARAVRAKETSERVARLRWAFQGRRKRRSVHAELSSSLRPQGEGTGGVPDPATTSDRRSTMRPRVPIICKHDGDAGLMKDGRPRCPMCRRDREAATPPPTIAPAPPTLFALPSDAAPDYDPAARAAGAHLEDD